MSPVSTYVDLEPEFEESHKYCCRELARLNFGSKAVSSATALKYGIPDFEAHLFKGITGCRFDDSALLR